ncbi:MAG: phosphoglycerate kinase [Candidatus Kapaibacterium sp.]
MIKSIDDVNMGGNRVLLRVDFNVPLDEKSRITDDMRITESLPTIDKIIDDGGIPIVLSHLGRPKGKWVTKLSLETVAKHLSDKFGYNVIFAPDCLGKSPKDAIEKAKPGDVVLLENLRFYNYEVANDKEFAKILAQLGDAYVNDAFGTVHRFHSSIYELPQLFKERYAGKSLSWELEYLKNAMNNVDHPYTAVIGGAKISDKIDIIQKLIADCDNVLIGGGMMFTFLKAMGYDIGRSIFEKDKIELAENMIEDAKKKNVNLLLPIDVTVAQNFTNDTEYKVVSAEDIPSDWLGMDIGPESLKLFESAILDSRTIVWNGPMGVFEMKKFRKGTFGIANALAKVTAQGAVTIIGGGDSAAALKKMNFMNKVTHVTPGGGAWLKYMEGKELPGVAALEGK